MDNGPRFSAVHQHVDAAMTDDDYLEAQRKARAESVEFFRSANKPERERWVARAFLTNLALSFTDDELIAVQDPPDVRFRDANFEIKEILDEGRRRHQEYKEGLEEAIRATAPSDLVRPVTFNELAISEAYDLILQDARTLAAEKYPLDVRRNLDLLFYVNLIHTFEFVETPFPDVTALSSLGWRSVSFVKGYRSCVLMATCDAPNFIRNAVGRVVHRKVEDETESKL